MTRLVAAFVFAVPLGALAQVVAEPSSLDNPMAFAGIIFNAVKSGNWAVAASAFAVLVIALLRMWGAKLHELLPDSVIWDKPLWFLFDTKPGGVLFNALVTSAGGIGFALMAAEPITWALLKPILLVSFGASTLWEWAKDIYQWWQLRKATAAGVAAAAAVDSKEKAVEVLKAP